MKRNKLSKIGAFFKARLDPDKIPPADWNTPDDDLLDGVFAALDETEEKPSLKIPWAYLILFLVLTLSLGYHFIRVASLKDQISILEESQAKGKDLSLASVSNEINIAATHVAEHTPKASLKQDESNSTTLSNQLTTTSTASQIVAKPIVSNPVKRSKVTQKSTLQNNIAEVRENFAIETNLNQELALSKKVNTPAPTIAHDQTPKEDIEVLSSIALLSQGIAADSRTVQIDHVAAKSNEPKQETRQKAIYASVGHLLTGYSMKNADGDYKNLWGYKELNSGWNVALGIQFELSKNTTLSTQLTYKNINNSSVYKEDLQYDSNKEYNNTAGDTMYDDDLRVRTTMGTFDDRIVMNMSDNAMQDGDLMKHETEISQSLHIIAIGAEIEQKLFHRNAFDLSIFASLAANKVLAWNQNLDTNISMNGDKNYGFSYKDDAMEKASFLFLDSSIGVRAGWQLTNKFSLDFSGAYLRSLSPINAIESTDAKTFIKGFQSNAGIRYSF